MTITAKYASTCATCKQPIAPGTQIEWAKGEPVRHTTCPDARANQSTGTDARTMPQDGRAYAGATGGVRHRKGSNRRAGGCECCGEWLAVGTGRLEYCVEDSGCREHHDYGGYHLYCADATACEARRVAARAERAERKATIAAASAAWQAATDAIDQPAAARPDWARDPIATWHAPVMVHTGACPAIYLSETEACYYIPGYFACDYDYPAVTRVAPLSDNLRAAIDAGVAAARAAGLLR